nr:copia protein [Tanacetum cinerariifolium]
MNKQIARDVDIARIHVEEELQMLIDGLDMNNETIAKYLQEYNQFTAELPIERRIELISDLVKYQDNYAKEEAERFKRKGLRLEQESVKKLKTSEELKATEEVPKEKVKEMMQLVHVKEIYVEALQVKHPIIDWEVHTKGQRSYWKIIRLGVEWKLYDTCGVHHVTSKDKKIFMLVEKDYPLRKGLGIVMISYKLQVEKSDLDTISLDDLYNHLKVYESEVQKKSESNSQNMAFISLAKHNSGNEEVNTASVSTAGTNVSPASVNIGAASISQDTACTYIATQSSGSQIKFEDINQIDEDDMEEMDIKLNMALLSMRADRAPRSQDKGRRDNYRQGSKVEEQTPKDLMAIDGVGWDWSYMENEDENHVLVAEEEAATEFALMAKTSAESEIRGLEIQLEFKINRIESLTNELELVKKEKGELYTKLTCFQTASKNLDNLLESQKSDTNKESLGYTAIPPPPAQVYSPLERDMSWTGLPEFVDDIITDYSRLTPTIKSKSNDLQNKNPSVTETKPLTSTILSKPDIKFVKGTDRTTDSKTAKVETAKTAVKYATTYSKPSKKSTVRGNQRNWNNLKSQQLGENFEIKNRACFYHGHFDHLSYGCGLVVKKRRSCPKNNCSNKSMTPRAVIHEPYRPPMRPVRPNMINFTTGSTKFSTADMGKRGNVVKATACWIWKPRQNTTNKGPNSNSISVMFKKYTYIDTQGKLNSCSRHMIGNISYLSDYEPFDGGYVSFGQGGCKITGKGTIKTSKLEFKNVYFVKDLKNFKLSDDTNVLLRTPKHHNMYSIDLNNIVPHKDLTCLVAKASADEYMLWHRRLGKFEAKGDEGYFIAREYQESRRKLACTKDVASQEVKKDVSSLRYIALPNWVHDALLESTSCNAQDTCTADAPKSSRNLNPTASTTNPPADPMETLAVETTISTVSSPVSTARFNDSQEPSSDTRLISKRVANQVETPSLDNILTLTNRFEDIIGVTTNLDDSNGVEADIGTMETTITTSPTPTLRIHKDHPKSQIIGPVDTPVQTKTKVRPIGTKWVLKNKKDERGIVIRNKARLVGQGHTQEEGIDYDEVFEPVARIKAIKLFLAYALFMGFIVYQMDGKSAFLYSTIDEEVYVMQPVGFQDPEFPTKVYKVEKAMYELHQAPRAWHQVTPKECHLHAVKRIFRYVKGHPKLGLWYPKESPFDLVTYSNSDYGGATQDRKSTTEGFQFLGRRLISWKCKKQTIVATSTTEAEYTIVATSTTEAEYVAGASGCGQVLWIQNQLFDYGPSFSGRIVPLFDSMLAPQGEGSGTPTESHHTPTSKASQSSQHQLPSPSLPPVSTESLPTVIPSDNPPLKQYTRRTRIAQSLVLSPVVDEPTSPLGDDNQCEACPTDSGFKADQDRANIARTSTLPSDSTPRVTSLAADEGTKVSKFQAQELEINSLKVRIKLLEDKDRGVAEQSGDDVPIKERRLDEGEEAAERVSDDTEVMETVLTSMDASSILTSGGVQVASTAAEVATSTVSITTGSGVVFTTSPTIPTAAPIFTTAIESILYTRRIGKETMVESKKPKKKKVQKQIDVQLAKELEEEMIRDTQRMNERTDSSGCRDCKKLLIERRIELISDLVKYQDNYAKVLKYQTQQRKPLTRKQQREFYTSVLRNQAGWKAKHFKGMKLEEIKEKFDPVWKQIQDFIPIGSKEEAERSYSKEHHVLPGRVPEPEDEATEESWVDEPKLGKPELDKLVLGKLEVGFDLDFGCLVVDMNYLGRLPQHKRFEYCQWWLDNQRGNEDHHKFHSLE